MNIVIPFRNTCGTQELKMCVKLIEKNMKDIVSYICNFQYSQTFYAKIVPASE